MSKHPYSRRAVLVVLALLVLFQTVLGQTGEGGSHTSKLTTLQQCSLVNRSLEFLAAASAIRARSKSIKISSTFMLPAFVLLLH